MCILYVCVLVCVCTHKCTDTRKRFFFLISKIAQNTKKQLSARKEKHLWKIEEGLKKKHCMKLRGHEMFHEQITFMMVLEEKAEQLRERALESFPGHMDTKVRD